MQNLVQRQLSNHEAHFYNVMVAHYTERIESKSVPAPHDRSVLKNRLSAMQKIVSNNSLPSYEKE